MILPLASLSVANDCIVRHLGGDADDAPVVTQALAECAQDSTITFSEGVDYNIFSPIAASNLSNVTINMLGNLHMPQNITHVQ